MSCNTKTSLAAVIDAVNAQLNNNYVDRDDPRIDQGVFTEPTIRGGLMLDEAAKLDFCGYVTECGQREPFGKQWVDRPLYPHNALVSYEDGGEIKSRWQDITDSLVIATANGVGTVARTQRDVNADTVHIKDFGAKCDGVTDDTIAFQTAILYAQDTLSELHLKGKILVTNQIELASKLWLKGNGAEIIFDNSEVDSLGNAEKGLFRFNGALKMSGSRLESFKTTFVQQTPKNQHAFIFNKSYIVDLDIYDVTVFDATGCIMWMVGSGERYIPAFHNPHWDSIRGYNVGGLIGQDSTSQLWCAGGTLSRFNIEIGINETSPREIMADLTGFRLVEVNNWIIEGAGHPLTKGGVYINGEKNTINNLYVEVVRNNLEYALHSAQGITVNKMFANGTDKIILSGGHSELHDVTFVDVNNDLELRDGATANYDNPYSYSNIFGDERPTVPRSKVGQVTLDNVNTNAKCRYSHNPNYDISWFKAGEYIDFSTPQVRTIDGTKVRLAVAAQTKLTPVNEVGLGRVSKLTTTKTNEAAYLGLSIDIPPSMRGSQVILGARVKVVSNQVIPVGTELFNNGLGFVNIGANEAGTFKKMVRSNNKMVAINTWQDMYVVLGEVQGEFLVQLFDFIGLSGVDFTNVEVHIADFKVSIGQELPNLAVANNEPVTLRAPAMPVEGYYMKGDIIYNTGTTDVVGWHRKTTGIDNTLGTDWVAFGEPVTEEIPTITSGPTDQRPTGVEVGFNYFDTTLAIPIYYKAVGEWVNSTGEVV